MMGIPRSQALALAARAAANVAGVAPAKPRKRSGDGYVGRRKAWLAEMARLLGVFVPVKTVCELNDHSHWRNRQRRKNAQWEAVWMEFPRSTRWSYSDERASGAVVRFRVKFTRYSVGMLDEGDNLQSSMKHVRDCLADLIGVNDRDPWYDWQYAQAKSPAGCYGVRIVIEPVWKE